MGMSTHVEAFKPADEKWARMAQVWHACDVAGVEPPDEVSQFFNDEAPDEAGVEIEESDLRKIGALRDWKSDSAEGFEIDTAKLPQDVTVIRFYNSW